MAFLCYSFINMKVILVQNVDNLGQKDDVKEVKPGYWRNFLFPQGLAVEATEQLLEQAKKSREEFLKQKEVKKEELTDILGQLKDKTLIIEARADEKGSLFAGIAAKKIAAAIKKNMNLEVDPDVIEIKKPIKEIGIYQVGIKNVILKIEIKAAKS